MSLKGRNFVGVADFDHRELETVLDLASELKRRTQAGILDRPLEGKILGLLFQKPSLRTRASFEVAMAHLGGRAIYMSPAEVGMGKREAVDDVAMVVSRYFDGLSARVFEHSVVADLAEHASIPVINALSDAEHPCQALADVLTIREWRGTLEGQRVVFVGDGNNVAISLALACAMTGAHFTLAAPEGYQLPDSFAERFAAVARKGATYSQTGDVREAATGSHVLYTDVWTSMGQEAETQKRLADFAGFCINAELVALGDDAIVLHCLPAHYGEEITRDVSRSAASAIWDQAENRLHAQKALLAAVLS
jgi:ornithine carbamoyltransferase